MQTMRWLCSCSDTPVLKYEEIQIPIKRMPRGGDVFIWSEIRWRVRDVTYCEDGVCSVEAVDTPPPTLQECPGCGGLIICSERCPVGTHRETSTTFVTVRPKKSRPSTLDAPLRDVVKREGNTETLSCTHVIFYREFKYIDRKATKRRCLVCCAECQPREVKRPRIGP